MAATYRATLEEMATTVAHRTLARVHNPTAGQVRAAERCAQRHILQHWQTSHPGPAHRPPRRARRRARFRPVLTKSCTSSKRREEPTMIAIDLQPKNIGQQIEAGAPLDAGETEHVAGVVRWYTVTSDEVIIAVEEDPDESAEEWRFPHNAQIILSGPARH
jgi:hypothetical protein